MNGIQEVSGSIPLISTKGKTGNQKFPAFFFCKKVLRGSEPPSMLRRFAVRQSRNRHYNAKVCVANGRSAASIPLISTKGKASQNLDVQGLRGFFLLLLQGCKLEINGRKKKKYEQFFRTFFVQLHFIFSTYSFRPFATSCMRVWRICVYISLVVWILLCPISSCVAFSSTLAS